MTAALWFFMALLIAATVPLLIEVVRRSKAGEHMILRDETPPTPERVVWWRITDYKR